MLQTTLEALRETEQGNNTYKWDIKEGTIEQIKTKKNCIIYRCPRKKKKITESTETKTKK